MDNQRIWKLGDNIDTDMIIPGRFLANWSNEPEKLKKYCLADVLPTFGVEAKAGDIIVAGKNFGCGSSREAAPTSIKVAGISAILAESYGRIFYRNSINIGLPAITVPHVSSLISEGDCVYINLQEGYIENKTKNSRIPFSPFPSQVLELIKLGGLKEYVLRRLEHNKNKTV